VKNYAVLETYERRPCQMCYLVICKVFATHCESSLCYRAMGVVKYGRGPRACGQRGGVAGKSFQKLRLPQLFLRRPSILPHTMRQSYGGPKLPRELRDQFGGEYGGK
jgi:hypothetical protein